VTERSWAEVDPPLLVERYLDRVGLTTAPSATVDGLEALMRAHLTAVPFENLDVYLQRGIAVDAGWSLAKILDQGRGGWCFELNGAFSRFLVALGFEVRLLGAAVLLGGPARLVDHLTLEVLLEGQPHLVDVGFGDGFARPLPLNVGPDARLEGGTGQFGFMPSPEGTTLVRYDEHGHPGPQYRFRRVSLTLDDFNAPSNRLYGDADGNFRTGPVATRLLEGGPDRVTLTTDRLRITRGRGADDEAVDPGGPGWSWRLKRWFGIDASALD